MANSSYNWKGSFSLEQVLSSLQNLKSEAAQTDKILEGLGDGTSLGKLVKQFTQLNNSISALRANTNSLKSDLGKSLQGGYISSLDQAIDKLTTLSELSQTIFQGINDVDLKNKSAPKQLEQYAKQLNLLFSNLGIDTKIDLELFNKKDIQAKYSELLNFAKKLNEQINITLGDIDGGKIKSEIDQSFAGIGDSAKKELSQVSEATKKVISDLEKQNQALEKTKTKLKEIAQEKKSGQALEISSEDLTTGSVQQLLGEFDALQEKLKSGSKSSIEYYNNLQRLGKVSLKIQSVFKAIKGNDTLKTAFLNAPGMIGDSSLWASLSKYSATKSGGIFDQIANDKTIKNIDSIINNNLKQINFLEHGYEQLTEKVNKYYNVLQKRNKYNEDDDEFWEQDEKLEKIEEDIQSMTKLDDIQIESIEDIFANIRDGALDAKGAIQELCDVLKVDVQGSNVESVSTDLANQIPQGAQKATTAVEGIGTSFDEVGNKINAVEDKANSLQKSIQNVFTSASQLELDVMKGKTSGKEYMNLFSADGTVSTVEGIGSKVDTDAIVGQMVASLKQNMVMSLHNHAHGTDFFSPADIESYAKLYYGQGTKLNGIVANGIVRTIDFSGISQEIAVQISESYAKNLKEVTSKVPKIFKQNVDNIELSDEVKNLEATNPKKYAAIISEVNELMHSALSKAITTNGVNPDSILGTFQESELPKLSEQLLQIQQNGQNAIAPIEKLKNLLTALHPDTSFNWSDYTGIFDQFEKGAIDGTEAINQILNLKTVAADVETVSSSIGQAETKLQEFLALANEISNKSFYTLGDATDNVEVGQYVERLNAAKAVLDELGTQGELTAEQLEQVNNAFNQATRDLDSKTKTYDSYYTSDYTPDYYDDYQIAQNKADELESENIKLREQLNKGIQQTLYETPDGQLSFFENMSTSAQRAEKDVASVVDEVKKLDILDGQLSFDDILKTSDDQSSEITQLNALKDKLIEVRGAVEAKTNAFNEEAGAVTNAVNSEVQALDRLIQNEGNQTSPTGLKITRNDLNAQKYKNELSGLANSLKKSFSELDFSLTTENLSPDQNKIRSQYLEVIALIDVLKSNIKEVSSDQVASTQSVVSALTTEINAYKERNNIVEKSAQKKNNSFGDTALINAQAKYNSIVKQLGYDASSKQINNNIFANSSVVQSQLNEYISAYQKLISMKKQLANSDVISVEDKAAFKNLQTECNDAARALEKIIKATNKLDSEGIGKRILGKDFDASDIKQVKAELIDFANELHGGKAANLEFNESAQALTYTVNNGDGTFTKFTASLNAAQNAIVSTAQGTGKATSTFGKFFDTLKGKAKSISTYLISMMGIQEVLQQIRRGIQYVRDIDSALTELKKVTDETDESYTKFLKNASKTAGTIGATLKDFTTVTGDFARLGYSMEESADLAKVALVYENVGDGFSNVSEASESIISTMKAFGIEATDTMSIVDKFNEVGNNFAITSKGIGDALQRSASSLYEAGNTLDESIGLITGMNSVVQDPEQVGTALKTLTMRLRGAKTELEDAGLDVDNMASSTSKLREQLLVLTGVDIMQDANTFKSTTQILREMSAVWEDLSDIDAAAALELMGGKRQANILASALKNWQTVEDAISTSLGSEGSALEENQKYLDSIQGRIDIFNNAVQTMWFNLISSDFIKGVVDVGTTLVEIFDSATGKVLAFVAALQLISKFKGFSGVEQLFGLGKTKIGGDFVAAIQLVNEAVKNGSKLLPAIKSVFGKGGGFLTTLGSFISGNWFTIALAALPVILAIVNKIKNRSAELKKEVQQINSAYQEQKETVEDNLKQLTSSSDTKKYGSLQAEFNHLARGVDEQGNNVSLAADEYERYRDICETIVGIQPGLAAGYDSATAAINNNASALSNLIEIQKKEERQAAEKYVSNDNLKKIAIDAINDYNDAQDILDDIFNDGTGYAIWDAAYQAYGEENDLSEHFGDNRVTDNVVREILRSINPFITDDEVSEQLKDYYYKNGNFNEQKWYQENMDLLEENIDSFPSELADRISEWTSGNTALKNAKQGMIDALLEVPKSLEKYDNFTTSEKSFMTDWIKNSGVFEIDEDTSAYTVLTWKEQIREMASALDADSLTTEIEGKQISASDILDSIYNLDPSTLNWEKYKSEMSGLIDHFWNAIGADDNQFGLKKDSLSKMFGFDEENLQEQYDFMFTRLSSILGKDSAEFQKWKAYIEGLDAVKVKRLIEVDWNVVDKNNLESTIKGALVDDFTVKSFSNYSDSIDSIKSNISTLQDALKSLESGSFTYSDFIELAQQFPELAEGVDTSSDAFDGLAINLQKAIKAAPDDLVNELKDLRKQLVETGKDTTAIDQLIDSIENLPTDAVDSLASKFGTLSDKISEANTAQGKLSAAMSKNPDANYKNTSEALQKMKELYDSGVVGSESQVWSIYESLTGKSYDYTKSLEDNKKALKDWIDTYDSWYLSTDDEEYSTAGLENFLNDVEAIVAKAKANGEEWAKDITWTYENGVAEIDFANIDWDTIADHIGVTSEMFADLMMHAGQFLEINWTQSSDIVDFFRKLEEEGKSASERLAEAEPYVKGFLENQGISSDWLDGNTKSIIDGKNFLQLSIDDQTILKEYWNLKDIVAQDPLEITAQLNTDKIEDGLSKESIASLQELVDVVTDADTGTTWLSFDELKNAAKEAGYTEEGINKLIAALDKYGDKVLDLNVTKQDPLGLAGMVDNVDAAVNYLKALEIEAQNVNGSLQIDLTSFVTNLKQAGLAVGEIQTYVSALPKSVSFTFNGNVINADETNSKISELYENVEDAPQEEIKVDLTGNAEDCLKSITNYLSGLSDKTITVTVDYKPTGTPPATSENIDGDDGTGGVNGTAHVQGTAYKSGKWGAPRTEKALTGELGPEMVVRGNKWFTVGDNGAEFTDIKKGDIIFNHKQTESLLKNGYVTGRGKAYASGTAYAGTAANEITKMRQEQIALRQARSLATTQEEESKIISKIIGAINAEDSKINGKLDSSGNNSNGNGGGGNNDKKDEEEKETFDFIEIKMEEIESLIEKITAKIALFLDDTSDINKKDNYYDQLVEAEKNKASTYLSAAEIYNNKAAELLKEVPEKYRDMAKNGALVIEDFVGEDEQKTIDAINNYREWAQKADEAEVGYLESVAQAAAYRVEQLDDIATDFENLTNQIETQAGLVQSHIDLIEESGNIVSEKFYKDLMKKTKEQRSELVREKQSLQKILDDAVKSGDVTVGTDEWFEMVQAIYDVDDAIIQCDIDLEGYQNSINELSWESFERLVDQLDNIDSELSFISDLMSKNDWEVVDEDANWTDKGITALGMYAQQMEIAQTKSQQYAKEIKELKRLRDKGLVSETEYIEKLAELKDGQMDAINAYEDAKDAIVDLNKVRIEAVKEGLQDELDAYQELIEKKKEALDADKDLYDFEKNVAEQQKEIAIIQRKIAALSGDNSLSATAQRRKLEAELLEAQADLEDTYRDRSYDNTIDALDKESEAYEESINTQIEELDKSLENIDAIVTESLATARANTDTVLAELVNLSKTYGIELSKEITSPWADGEAAISAYSESFKNLKDSFAEELNYLIEQEKILQKEADKAAQSVINSLGKNESTVEGATNPDSSKKDYQSPTQKEQKNSDAGMVSSISGYIQYGQQGSNVKKLQTALNELGFNCGSVDGIFGDKTFDAVKKFQSSSNYGGAISADGIVGPDTKKKFKTAGYAKGTLGTKKDELALIDELGEELVMHAGPDGKLMFLSKGSSVIPSNITENLMKIGQLDPTEVLKRSTPSIGAPHITNNNIEVNMQIAEVVHIDEVTNETIPDLTKAVEKQMDKYMKNLNGQIRKYAR